MDETMNERVTLTHTDYTVEYEPETSTITCQGKFRLRSNNEYMPIIQLLRQVADKQPETIVLDVRKLDFLNSSGINVLSKFIIRVRGHKASKITIKGVHTSAWQQKSLKNFQRLLPSITLEVD